MAHRVDIRILSFDVKYIADTVLPIPYLKNISGVDVDLKTGQIYWTDSGEEFSSKVIKKANFDGKGITNVIDSGIDTVDSLVVDSVGRKVWAFLK